MAAPCSSTVAVDFDANDLWWNGDITDTAALLTATLNQAPGVHTIEAYGSDGCCDGPQIGQFLAANADPQTGWTTFGANDGLTPAPQGLPEPASLALVMLAGAAALRRRSR